MLRQPVKKYKRHSHDSIQGHSYILRLAVEADQRAFAGVQVLGGGNGGGEEGERAAQDFESRIYNSLSHMYIVCIQVYPTGTGARVATPIGRVESLGRLGGGGRCADLHVAARDAVKERLLLRAVATCCADRVEHRTAHYYGRWSLRWVTYSRALDHLKLDLESPW